MLIYKIKKLTEDMLYCDNMIKKLNVVFSELCIKKDLINCSVSGKHFILPSVGKEKFHEVITISKEFWENKMEIYKKELKDILEGKS